ncbi:MAG: hypothetical protein RLZZ387_5609 [Chloroflexota bacterium]|jgi:predicted acetyltransferase
MDVTLEPARPTERALLANLFELYLYDFTAVEPQPIGPDGRFSTPDMLTRYWDEEERHPFLIRAGKSPTGFALVKRGSELAGDLEAMDVAEFFVLRGHRGAGVGRRAAHLLWDAFPGPWVVRVLAANTPALAFWETAISAYTGGSFLRDHAVQADRSPPRAWHIFRFEHPRAT